MLWSIPSVKAHAQADMDGNPPLRNIVCYFNYYVNRGLAQIVQEAYLPPQEVRPAASPEEAVLEAINLDPRFYMSTDLQLRYFPTDINASYSEGYTAVDGWKRGLPVSYVGNHIHLISCRDMYDISSLKVDFTAGINAPPAPLPGFEDQFHLGVILKRVRHLNGYACDFRFAVNESVPGEVIVLSYYGGRPVRFETRAQHHSKVWAAEFARWRTEYWDNGDWYRSGMWGALYGQNPSGRGAWGIFIAANIDQAQKIVLGRGIDPRFSMGEDQQIYFTFPNNVKSDTEIASLTKVDLKQTRQYKMVMKGCQPVYSEEQVRLSGYPSPSAREQQVRR